MPYSVCKGFSRVCVAAYCFLTPARREAVIQNLLPALNYDRPASARKAKRLFGEFGLKLVDLFRYEAGLPIEHLLGQSTGWEHFLQARAQKRGVLIITPHLGNWEFGGPWLTKRGFDLQVITQTEPGQDFTQLRQQSRARWNVETLVIGDDPFAFLEAIRRLENGATVALLVDRPPAATAVTVQLFGRSFSASIAAAELARASGCVLLPVYLPRVNGAYAAHVLPAITYDRAALRDRGARQQLTQRIIAAFEPIIGQYLEQWFHFVPIWPDGSSPTKSHKGVPDLAM
jgi:KDO2-lipid IV(A) lauroyltransferase